MAVLVWVILQAFLLLQVVKAQVPVLQALGAGKTIKELLVAGKVDEERTRQQVWFHLSGPDGVISEADIPRLLSQAIPEHKTRLVSVDATHPFIQALPDIPSTEIDKTTFATQVWPAIMRYQPGCACGSPQTAAVAPTASPPASAPPSASPPASAFMQIFDKVACSIDVLQAANAQCTVTAARSAPAPANSTALVTATTRSLRRRSFWSFFSDMVSSVVHVVTAVVDTVVTAVQTVVEVIVDPFVEAFNVIGGLWQIAKEQLEAMAQKWAGLLEFAKDPRRLQQSLWEGAKAVFNLLDAPFQALTSAINNFIKPSVSWILSFLDFMGPVGFFMQGMIEQLISDGLDLLTLLTPTGIFHFVADLGGAIVPLFDLDNLQNFFGGIMQNLQDDPIKTVMTLHTVAGSPAKILANIIVDQVTSQPDEKSKWKEAGKISMQILSLVVPFLGEKSAATNAAKSIRRIEQTGAFLSEEALSLKPGILNARPTAEDFAGVTKRLQDVNKDLELFSRMSGETFWIKDADGFMVLKADKAAEFEQAFSAADRERFKQVFEKEHGWKIKPTALDSADSIETFYSLCRRSFGPSYILRRGSALGSGLAISSTRSRMQLVRRSCLVDKEIAMFKNQLAKNQANPKMIELVQETFELNLNINKDKGISQVFPLPAGVTKGTPQFEDAINNVKARAKKLSDFMTEASQNMNVKEGASRLASRVTGHQIFEDGNHRTSLFMMYKWFEKNDVLLDVDPAILKGLMGKSDGKLAGFVAGTEEYKLRWAQFMEDDLKAGLDVLESRRKLPKGVDQNLLNARIAQIDDANLFMHGVDPVTGVVIPESVPEIDKAFNIIQQPNGKTTLNFKAPEAKKKWDRLPKAVKDRYIEYKEVVNGLDLSQLKV
ncbi:hypothetical protein HK102_001449 [Quaeritorhiza haematococci]|nr:hypothetical protein HK102_001449 [Quaeritorhiza haematococci]